MTRNRKAAVALGLAVGSLAGLTGTVSLALNEDNPYTAIAGRNVFALRPAPVNVVTNIPAPNPAPGVELQGFTTILGRQQVLLKVKLAAKPPEPARDQSYVMDVGQREGDIEVVGMDAYAGTVTLKNQGNSVALNLKDNGAKPQAGPPIAAPAPNALPGARPNMPGLPNVPPAAHPAGGISASSFGGAPQPTSGGTLPTLPTRNLRSGANSGHSVQNDARALPLDAQMALIEVERERTRDAVQTGKMPPLPPINLPK